MGPMAAYEHLVKSYDVGDELDDIASANPPAYLRRCFAEGHSASVLSWARVQHRSQNFSPACKAHAGFFITKTG